MRTRRVDVGPLELEIVEARASAGDGPASPLLLVHGFTGSKEDLAEGLDGLAGHGWHAVAPDLRGHGRSAQPPGEEDYLPELMVSDLLNLADRLGWDTFALLGHSMGGALAQLLAVEHPQRVSALVLVSTFCGPVAGLRAEVVAMGTAIVRQGGLEALAPVLAARRESDPVAMASRRRIEAMRPGWAEKGDRRLLSCSDAMWLSLAPRFLSWPETAGPMGSVSIPTLVVCGSDDATMRPDCERLAAAVPGSRLVVVDGVGHSPQLEAPEAFWAEVSRFLESTRRTAAAPG